MKLHKLSSIIILVLLSAILLAAPVQAGRTVIPFTFGWTDIYADFLSYRIVGTVEQFSYIFTATIVSEEPRLDGAKLTMYGYCTRQLDSPHPPDPALGGGWGPTYGTWSIITSAEGEPASGWQGVSHIPPQGEPARWPDFVLQYRASGNGFGEYKNTRLTYTCFVPPYGDWPTFIYSAELTVDSE